MKISLLLTFICLLFYSCQTTPVDIGEATNFFPNTTQLREGIALKYYEHNNPTNKDESFSTNIGYRTMQFFQPNRLVVDFYNAALTLKEHTVFEIEDNQFSIVEKYYYPPADTIQAELIDNVMFNWEDNNAVASYKLASNGYQTIISNNQTALRDTTIDGRICKMIKSDANSQVISPTNDTTIIKGTLTNIYAEGLGLMVQDYSREEMSVISELVEQMSLKEFKKRAIHGKKRIAYIDPNNTIDDNSDFKLCNHEIKIADYYGCKGHSKLTGGKGRWWRILEKELDIKKLKKESGYLTYRFVLNCKGEVGRFMTEEADLDFNKKKFDKETVDHLYQIVSAQKDWKLCYGRDDNMFDAYLYITFKLKDGKIIEILP